MRLVLYWRFGFSGINVFVLLFLIRKNIITNQDCGYSDLVSKWTGFRGGGNRHGSDSVWPHHGETQIRPRPKTPSSSIVPNKGRPCVICDCCAGQLQPLAGEEDVPPHSRRRSRRPWSYFPLYPFSFLFLLFFLASELLIILLPRVLQLFDCV